MCAAKQSPAQTPTLEITPLNCQADTRHLRVIRQALHPNHHSPLIALTALLLQPLYLSVVV